MLLAVDMGNSQTSFGIISENKFLYHWRAETKISRTAEEFAALLFPLLDHAGLRNVSWKAIVLCSVVPPAEHAFEQFCKHYLNQKVFKIHSELALGFGMGVSFPKEVGADRLANAAYAIRFLKLPSVVVDFGTATTFDVVSAKGIYEGGAILPGVRISIEALSSRTSKLPWVDLDFPQSVIGKNTAQCIQSGVLYGYCDMIDGLLTRVSKELGSNLDVALTGGLAFLFHERLKTETKLLPNLTLEGILALYDANR